MDARNRGDQAQAEKLKAQALEKWDKSERTYDDIKKFAPNYVQTHHQMGLVHLKRGDLYKFWGDEAKNKTEWDAALKHFALYKQLDPVFPPNYYRIAYIHYTRGEFDKAEEAYKGALTYNMKNVVGVKVPDRNAETFLNLARLAYVLWTNKHQQGRPNEAPIPSNNPEFEKTVSYYKSAVEESEKIGDPDSRTRWLTDSLKGLAVSYARAGRQNESVDAWQKLRAINPQDPDVKNVFRSAPAAR
jgi:tetratricopeptide (TPR) repeat protein